MNQQLTDKSKLVKSSDAQLFGGINVLIPLERVNIKTILEQNIEDVFDI